MEQFKYSSVAGCENLKLEMQKTYFVNVRDIDELMHGGKAFIPWWFFGL